MRIIHIAAEFAPIAKAGGLGEVVTGLARELIRQHHDVTTIIPKYSLIDNKTLEDLDIELSDLRCVEKNQPISNIVWSAKAQECPLRLIDARHPSGYFHRDTIYGFADDIARFLYFSRTAVEYLKIKNEPIDVLHLHEWHTAACAVLLRDLFASEIRVKSIILTIHNLEYQGKCAAHDLDAIGLRGEHYLTPDRLQDPDPRYPQTVNLLKGGILYADAVNTVSPSYAKEILTPQMGFGLSNVLRKAKVTGILNGIDSTMWDPEKDPLLISRYGAKTSLTKIGAAKQTNGERLKKEYGIDVNDRPVFGTITRLVPAKGTDLLLEAIPHILQLGGSFILLASTPMPETRRSFEELKKRFEGNPNLFMQFSYNEALSHQIYAALDFILVPSLTEPCGLNQLIALRYGTVPIVRSTGGLKDTVFDCEDGKVPIEQRNGFLFYEATPSAIKHVIERAVRLYRTDKATFQDIARRGMQCDYSWKEPTQEYLRLYRKTAGY